MNIAGKYPTETVPIRFDFSALLPATDSVASAEVTAAVHRGDDPDPGAILPLAPVLPGDRAVDVWVQGGIAGTDYLLTVTAEGTPSAQRLTLHAILSVHAVGERTALLQRIDDLPRFRELLTSGPAADLFDAGSISDDLLWERLRAAEGELESRLRVFLGAVQVVPEHLAEAETPALEAAGTRYVIDEGYDYTSGYFHGNRWGLIEPRYTPIIDVQRIDYVYPIPDQPIFTIPIEWARPDRDGGFIRIVPAGTMYAAGSLNALILSMLSGGRTVPHMLQLKYRAGLTLERIRRDFPQLPTLIKHQALVMMLTERGFPSSTSISADGLSESAGLDIGKFRADIDEQIDQLRQKIHGLRLTVI